MKSERLIHSKRPRTPITMDTLTAIKEKMNMIKNIGETDQLLRIGAGLLILMLALFTKVPLFEGTLLMNAGLVIGVVLIGTALIKFCPLYCVLNMRT